MNADFEQVKATDPIVKKALAAGGTLEDVIVALVRHTNELGALFGDMEIASTKLMQLPCIGDAKPLQGSSLVCRTGGDSGFDLTPRPPSERDS